MPRGYPKEQEIKYVTQIDQEQAPRQNQDVPHSPFMEEDLKPVQVKWFFRAMEALDGEGVRYLVAGAFGLHHHTGFWRGTKDLDLLVLPKDREVAIEAVAATSLQDMFYREPYDRAWIYRSTRDGVIVDLIWQLANKEDEVDESWFERGQPADFFGKPVQMVSAADLCWMKLFVFQLQRCDWPDIINIIRGTQGKLDWDVLLRQVGPHWRLLCAVVDIYDWLCPAERTFIPPPFRQELERRRRSNMDADLECHRDLFDSRPWLTDPGAAYSPYHPAPGDESPLEMPHR
jgi:hypothetical protein